MNPENLIKELKRKFGIVLLNSRQQNQTTLSQE